MLIVDPPAGVEATPDDAIGPRPDIGTPQHDNAALYFPRLRQPNPLRDNQLEDFAPCGVVAGIYRPHRRAARRLEGAGRPGRDARRGAVALSRTN